MDQPEMVAIENLTKAYAKGGRTIRAIDDVSLSVAPGEFLAINGPSGSGKTTLLLAIAGLIRPTSGKVRVAGVDLHGRSPRQTAHFRAQHVGFVFQTFYLVPYLTAVENVRLAQAAAGSDDGGRTARQLLDSIGLADRKTHYPSELSAGEQQRVALARALVNQPRLLLGDEPTGNLDTARGGEILDLISRYNKLGGTVILVTHSSQVTQFASRTLDLVDGKLING